MKRVITSLLAILFVLPMVFPFAACTMETGGENMANYLYNGVELPDINTVWTDKETYPYAYIQDADGLLCLTLASTKTQFRTSGSYVSDTHPEAFVFQNYLSNGNGWVSYTSGSKNANGYTTSTNQAYSIIWSNHDVVDYDNNSVVYLAASDPVPVGGSKLTISTGGSANGDGMALYNGVMLPNINTVWTDKTTYPYAFLQSVKVGENYFYILTVSSSTYSVSGTDFIADADNVNSSWFLEDGVWKFGGSGSMEAGSSSHVAGAEFWTSFDVFNSDGTIYLSSYSPILLDGMNVIEWDGSLSGDYVELYSYYHVQRIGNYLAPDVEGGFVAYNAVADTNKITVYGSPSGSYGAIPDSYEADATIFDDGSWLVTYTGSDLNGGVNALLSVKDTLAVTDSITLDSGLWVPVIKSGDNIIGYTPLVAYRSTSGGVTDTTATVNFSCKDLLYTDPVYRIKAWVYEPGAGGSGTMLYNGVELPELPEWDKDTYPYAFIEIQKDFIYLHCLKTKFHYCYSEHYACYAMLPYYGDSFAYFYFYRELDSETGTWTDGWKTGSAVDYGTGSYGFPERWSEKLCVWANYDVLNCYHVAEDPECDCPIYLAASDPVPAGGPDVTQPPTFTSELFAGPSHSESHTLTGLTPATEYGIYAVIWSETDGAATEHNATATFTTLEGEAPTGTIQFGAANITGTGFTAVIEASGLDDATAYTAEIVVYNTATSAVAAEAVRSFTGNYTMAIDFAGLTPETDYTVAVDVYPTDTGKVVARGEFPVTTGQEEPKTSWRDSFLLGFASGLGCTAATKTDADHNAWMQGYIVGEAFRKML